MQLSACRVISGTIVVVLTARRIRAELHVYSRTTMKAGIRERTDKVYHRVVRPCRIKIKEIINYKDCVLPVQGYSVPTGTFRSRDGKNTVSWQDASVVGSFAGIIYWL